MIAAILGVANDEDIVGQTVSHMLEHVDHIFIVEGGSEDSTFEILESLRVKFPDQITLFVEAVRPYDQEGTMNRLAQTAAAAGAEWIVPFDADEFIIPMHYPTIREELENVPPDITILMITPWWHLDWERKVISERYNKVAFRWCEGAEIWTGQHDVNYVNGSKGFDYLNLREIQYRSYEHFRAKVAFNLRSNGPIVLGNHYKELAGFSEEQMRAVWDEFQSMPTVIDPIPSNYPL